MNYSFYPFKNRLEEINGADLRNLKEVSEGWYIDYKERTIKVSDYAKHLSAFSNQYGGWLIIGVREKDNGSRKAGEFPGVKNNEVEKILLAIREASSAHVNPEVYYEEKVIAGPIKEVNLPKDHSVIIIGIPQSNNTPHIHSSGRIYRRLSDQSKPKAETDRYILDELWKRSEKYKKQIIKKLTTVPELPEKQSSQTWGYIFFKPRSGQPLPKNELEFDDFSKIMRNLDNSVHGVHAPLNSVHTTENGFVARQTSKMDPGLAALTLRWWHDGSVRFDIPFRVYNLKEFCKGNHNNKHYLEYIDIVKEHGYTDIKIIDYSIFFQIVAALANSYIHLLDITEDKRDYFSCFTIKNLFYSSPYIDSEKYINRTKSLSIPLTTDSELKIPTEPTEDNMFKHSYKMRKIQEEKPNAKQARPYIFSIPIVYSIFNSVGIVSKTDDLVNDLSLYGHNKIK
ncbi:helix-turn-helix domain-containing protein [Microbulbifer sp. CnH-101-E]|uniref:AlbA family DNA-binding domain-containing protein n=1 Tax=unclassified Microbulbifer TaxID=2619833 RepID=UPI004039E976